jgi:hypothetical protein
VFGRVRAYTSRTISLTNPVMRAVTIMVGRRSFHLIPCDSEATNLVLGDFNLQHLTNESADCD